MADFKERMKLEKVKASLVEPVEIPAPAVVLPSEPRPPMMNNIRPAKPPKQPAPPHLPTGKAVEKKGPTPKKAKKQRPPFVPPVIQRLPPGSKKVLVWDGENWYGELTVPDVLGFFHFTAPNEKGCFHGLHSMYVNFLEAQKVVDTAAPPG